MNLRANAASLSDIDIPSEPLSREYSNVDDIAEHDAWISWKRETVTVATICNTMSHVAEMLLCYIIAYLLHVTT